MSLQQQEKHASYNINGVTIHSLLRLPIASATQKDLSGQALSRLKEKLLHTDDWKQLLACKPFKVPDIHHFQDVVRLYYTNAEVAYNYDCLVKLNQPIAEIHAKHSSDQTRRISAEEMFHLQPKLLIVRDASVMLTKNLWPSELVSVMVPREQ